MYVVIVWTEPGYRDPFAPNFLGTEPPPITKSVVWCSDGDIRAVKAAENYARAELPTTARVLTCDGSIGNPREQARLAYHATKQS